MNPPDTEFEFSALHEAQNYQRALIATFAPHLRGRVVEVGSGIGQMTAHLSRLSGITHLHGVEPDQIFVKQFKQALPHIPLVEGTVRDLPGKDWNGVVSINVLEHIDDDQAELNAYHRILVGQNGILTLFVPARQELYADIDRDFGHFRRHDKAGLKAKLEKAGFRIKEIYYYDCVGYVGWWVNFRLLKQRKFNPLSVRLFDRLIFPVVNFLESRVCRPPIGKNILVIAEAR